MDLSSAALAARLRWDEDAANTSRVEAATGALRDTLGELQFLAGGSPRREQQTGMPVPTWAVGASASAKPPGEQALQAASETINAQSERIADLTAAADGLGFSLKSERQRRQEAEELVADLRRQVGAAEEKAARAEAAVYDIDSRLRAQEQAVEAARSKYLEQEAVTRAELDRARDQVIAAEEKAAAAARSCSGALLEQLREREDLCAAFRQRVQELERSVSEARDEAEVERKAAAQARGTLSGVEADRDEQRRLAQDRKAAYEELRQRLETLVRRLTKQLQREAHEREEERGRLQSRVADLERALMASGGSVVFARGQTSADLYRPPPQPQSPSAARDDSRLLARIEQHLLRLAPPEERGGRRDKEEGRREKEGRDNTDEVRRLRKHLRRSRDELRKVSLHYDHAKAEASAVATALPWEASRNSRGDW